MIRRAWVLIPLFVAVAPAPVALADDQQPAPPVFEEVLPTLDEALELIDQHGDLPRRTFLFGEDQRSNRRKINDLLDQAISTLGVSGLSEKRDQIRELEQKIRDARTLIAEYQRKRISAPAADSQGLLSRANPFSNSREDYDKAIAAEEQNIAAWQEDSSRLRGEFAQALRSVGLELDEAAVEALLASVTGDDIVAMAIVFDNVRLVTDKLQFLTEESGEQLDTAKRYYGMYVVLVEVLNHIQEQFILEVQDQYIPALHDLDEQAQKNIEQAERLIRRKGGDEKILRANIAANETTRQAARHYVDYLTQQADMVRTENAEVKKTLATAMNTYETVKLSSDLAALMETGRQSFNALMRLRLPYLREFQNESIRREFQRMTEQLRKE